MSAAIRPAAHPAPDEEVPALAGDLLRGAGCGFPLPPIAASGQDPVLPSAFPLATGFAGVAAACGAAVSELWRRRTGRSQPVAVDIEESAAALVSFRLARRDGRPMPGPGDGHPYVGLYQARDGRWVAIHGGFPSLEAPVRALLDGAATREAVTAAVARRDARDWEDRFAAAQPSQCCVMVRTAAEWRATEQGSLLAAAPVVELRRIGDAPPEPLHGAAKRPLSGVRVMDLTRILAGPVAGRVLAANGAEVLLLSSPNLPNVEPYLVENSHGKRSAWLDLETTEGQARLRALAADADVLVQSYRTGSLARRGFGPEALAALRPGLIHVSINCFGHEGPWRERPGWELLGQSASGMATEQGTEAAPALVRAYPCDYTTGYLAALGALGALIRRQEEGGSWAVRVSLARSGMWMHGLGARFPRPSGGYRFAAPEVPAEGLDRFRRTGRSPYGEIGYLPPPIHLPETEPHFAHLSVPPGTDEPAWLPRGDARR
jgi:crotonobetainyl-CoA:carnitine CoA-transferase CaiB-like acyl-CoA transferase